MTSAACSICSRPVRTRAALLPARWAPRDITRSPRARTRFARNPAPGPPPLKPWPGPRGTWPRLTGTRRTRLGGQRREEGPDVLDEQFGRFQRGEMATGLEVAPVHDVVGALGVAADGDVLGEDGHAGGNGPVARMHGLVLTSTPPCGTAIPPVMPVAGVTSGGFLLHRAAPGQAPVLPALHRLSPPARRPWRR